MALMLAAAACIGIQGLFVKLAGREIHPVTLAFLRFAASYLLMRAAIGAGWTEVRPVNRRILWVRGILGGIGSLLLFLAVTHTRLSNAVVLFYTYPIFSALIVGLIHGTALSFAVAGAFAASFVGVYLIVQPSFDTVASGDVFGLLAALTAGGAIVSLKVSRATETSWTVFHYYNIAGMLVTAPFLLAYWTTPTIASIPVLLAVLVFSILGQLGTTYAYRFTTAVEGGVLSMFGAVVGGALGIGALGEEATPHFLAGALLVLLTGIYLTVRGTEDKPVTDRP
ncbi:MAG TPA: DMT family transporter [Nitrospiria bacterium]|nr:DMT family transporter [Nitrospiria bacterium]